MKKKWVVISAASAALVGAMATVTMAANPIYILVNGTAIQTDVPAQIISNRTFVPARVVAEALGASVNWDSATNTISINSASDSAKDDQITMLEQGYAADTADQAVNTWATGVKKRNGAEQFAVMNADLRSQVRAAWELQHWVTGASSPWVDSYTLASNQQTSDTTAEYDVVFYLHDSTGFTGVTDQLVDVQKVNNNWYISKITPQSASSIPYHQVMMPNGPSVVSNSISVSWQDISFNLTTATGPKDIDSKALVQEVVGNHAENLTTESVTLPIGQAILATFDRGQPAASGSDQLTREYWLIVPGDFPNHPDQQLAYCIQAVVTGDQTKAKNELLELGQHWSFVGK